MIQKFRLFLRKRGIKFRMVFAFIVLPLGVMVLFFLLYYFFSMRVIVSKNQENSQTMVNVTEENIYLNTMKIEEQLHSIVSGNRITNVLLYREDTYKNEFQAFMKDTLYLEEREDLQIFDQNGSLLYREENSFKIDIVSLMNAYGGIQEESYWVYDDTNHKVLLVQSINNRDGILGYVVCGFEDKAFSPSFASIDTRNNMLIVVDEHDRYLFGSSILKRNTKIDTSKDELKLLQGIYYVESKPILNMKWKIVNLVSRDFVLEEFNNFRNMLLLYGLVILIILEFIATLIYRSIYDPLHNILKTMRTIDENNLVVTRVVDDGNDEIHEVATNVNELLDRVEELLKTAEMEQENKRETQFQLLQAQINPHFLFNTLNTLHFLAIMNEDKPVSEGIGALAKLLRNTIVDSKEFVSVKEEIENLKNYIIIQKLRFGDLFETVYNVDEDVQDCNILKFLLQPIVENSILHAFEEDKQYQIVTIRIQKQDTYLKIEIGDNGKGFQQENKEKKRTTLSGIGIDNISQRIQLMYGEQYSMTIMSVPNIGTIVTLRLPYVKGDTYV